MVTVLWMGVGCSSGAQHGRIINLDTEIIRVDPNQPDFSEADPVDLFDEANDFLRAGDDEEALVRYLYLVEAHPDSHYTRASLYNSGLCYEGLAQWDDAARLYEYVVETWTSSVDAKDGFYRWAEARAQLGDWEGVPDLMERVLRRAHLTITDRAEAHLRWGNALLEMRDWARAEQHYREVLRISREDGTENPLAEHHPIVMQSHYGLGRAYHELFLEIRLVLPQAEVERALIDKAQLLEQARVAYLEVVRAGHPYWSVAAGFLIGQIYEDFYLDVLACEVPRQFDEYTLEVYFEELREFLGPVVNRAMSIYEDNLAMAERIGADSVWVEETRMAIRRVQDYMFDDDVRREQESLIRRQRHPHGAMDPHRAWIAPSVPET